MFHTKSSPGITIVIPAYNEAAMIGPCLDAVAAQTQKPDAVIVVDNGSTDATAAIAQAYPFVTLVREPAQGRWHARKAGLLKAKTELVGQIDADTRLSPDWVASAKKLFIANKDMQIATGTGVFYNMPLQPIHPVLINICYYRFQQVLSGQMVAWGANMVVRRKASLLVSDLIPFDDAYDEDVLMALMMRRNGHKTHLSHNLKAKMSLRRSNMKLADTMRYIKTLENNHHLMRQPRRARFVRVMSIGYVVTTVLLIGLKRLRDPDTSNQSA